MLLVLLHSGHSMGGEEDRREDAKFCKENPYALTGREFLVLSFKLFLALIK